MNQTMFPLTVNTRRGPVTFRQVGEPIVCQPVALCPTHDIPMTNENGRAVTTGGACHLCTEGK